MNKAIGEILKKARREQGMKLPEVSTKLCISKSYLRALEGNDKNNLPAQTFTIGFLRTYATHLGLDADALVNKAKGATPQDIPAVEVNVPEPEQDSTMPSLIVLVAIAGAFASLATGYTYFADSSEDVVLTEQQPQALLATVDYVAKETIIVAEADVAPTQEVAEEVVKEAPEATATLEQFVEIRATADTWMMIADSQSGNVYDDIIHKGETYQASVGKGLHLTTGNAGGLEFYHSGLQLPIPSGHGVILNAIALDQVILEPNSSNSQQQELSP